MKHLIRQERTGGYWLVRDEGRAIELGDAAYEWLAALHAVQGRLAPAESARLQEAAVQAGNAALAGQLARYGLDQPAAWDSVRLVPRDVPRDQVPADAVVAPKRIY